MRLFHYTDVNAVKSILEHGKLWLTDLRFMNDSEEMSHGVNHLKEVLEGEWLREQLSEQLSGESFSVAVKFVLDALADHVERYMDYNPSFVCSFSRSDDSLSQWRAYGNYSIEFSGEEIEQHLRECQYDSGVKSSIAEIALEEAILLIAEYLGGSSGRSNPAALQEYLSLISMVATFKHESFAEEREVRIIVDKLGCDYPFRFRGRGDVLIPFIEVPIPLKSIVAIKVGPMKDQDLAFRSMCMFVDELQRSKEFRDIPIEEIKVTKSKAPFRSV